MTETTRHARTPLVLIINDQEWSTRALESILSPNGYAVLRAYTGAKGVERAQASPPDVIVVGAALPDVDGLEVCRQLRSGRVSDSTPIIVTTTAKPSRADRLAALRAGAWDYLGHPLDGEELLLRFDAFVRAKQDADRARDEGLVDRSTGFYSVAGLARRAQEMGSQAYRLGSPFACVVFSAAADAERPEAATAGLVGQLVEALRKHGRVSDAIGRIGEADFALFAPGADDAGAASLARRVSEALQPSRGQDMPPLLVGHYAVTDIRQAGLQPGDMLERATEILHEIRRRTSSQIGALH
jgi:response regulator RpfG family c-di-GMP phosphodiesterase